MTDDVIPLGPPDADVDERETLPEHERDDDTTIGGGVMSSGGTAVDRGTGELDGTAQGPEPEDRDEEFGPVPMNLDEELRRE